MSVSATHPLYDRWIDRWRKCQDVVEGEEAVKEAGEKYLPRLSGHEKDSTAYNAYKERAWLYNATGRTVEGLLGLVFRRPPSVTVPPALEPFLEDVTGDGQSLESFAREVLLMAITNGRFGILSDYSMPPETTPTKSEAERMGLRPVLASYRADQITNWATVQVGSVSRGKRVIVKEWHDDEENDDEFAVEQIPVHRVFELDESGIYRQRFFRPEKYDPDKGREHEDQVKWQEFRRVSPMIAGQPLRELPVLIGNAYDVSWEIRKPPILDMANVNLAWYRNCADREHGLLFAGNPQPWITGHMKKDGAVYKIGSSELWVLKEAEAKVGYLEFDGQGLKPIQEAMDEKKGMLALLGSRILARDPQGVEAAETAKIHRQGESSVLATIAGTVSLALTEGLKLFADWLRIDGSDINVELNADFDALVLSAEDAIKWMQVWQQGGIRELDLYSILLQGEILTDPTLTFEQWKEEREAELPPAPPPSQPPPTEATE